MDSMPNTLLERRRTIEEKKKSHSANGCFNISFLNSKCFLKLKGDFDSENIGGISEVIAGRVSFHKKYLELDMSEVGTINMRAMARISISLKMLKNNGMYTQITGLDGGMRKIAYELGMHYITQII